MKEQYPWKHEFGELKHFHDKRIAVFGPNYIWTGNLVQETEHTVTLTNVNQLFETGSHKTEDTENERICDTMTFFKAAICNIGDPIWTNDEYTKEKK
jgi:hypothetical protein